MAKNPKFQLIPAKSLGLRETGDMIGKKRPAIRSINDIKNFMLESIELHACGRITAAEMRARTAASKDTAEVHAAVKLMELQGISFDLDANPTGIDYKPVVRRTRTQRTGMTAKGPIEEDIMQEVQEASGEESLPQGLPPSLADRLAFSVRDEPTGQQPDDEDQSEGDDTIPW